MRKFEQRRIIDMIRTLGDMQQTGAYAECQDGALEVGEYIEQIAGEGTQTVSLLEEYCDILFKVHNGELGKNQLKNHLIKVENSVRAELKPDKFEVVFLPYKRSMSDALESIWRRALNDPRCNAYIIPVPYYDLLPGKIFGEMHYEGDLYPPDLPITDWREYNIEERHPDVIFTHYSYDDESSITSLHTDFYSKRLRNLTDLLVHVPYHVCIDGIADSFCESWGIMYSGRVVVHSEKERAHFVSVLKRLEIEHNCKGYFGKPEEKFINLGSPKFDAVINSSQSDFELPDRWRKLIENADGTKKKVIFYNTSIGAILGNDEQYLQKIRFVFNAFRERTDVVLWWRPHPLSQAAYSSMRTQILGEYIKCVEDYINEDWGIFDDSAELHRAISWSDAYYGDESSVVMLFTAVGKPLMLANVGIHSKNAAFDPTDFIKPLESMNTIRDCFYYESQKNPLNSFIDFIAADHSTEAQIEAETKMKNRRIEIVRSQNVNADGSAGQAIYDYVKKHAGF